MTGTLKDLRKAAGYKTARDFAAALEIRPTTYSRYEQHPENIPIKVAWQLADALGCSIDVLVGREHVSVDEIRGDQQRFYDGLSPENRILMDEFSEFLALREKKATQSKARRRRLHFDALCAQYLELFYSERDSKLGFGEPTGFDSSAEERAAFIEFLKDRSSGSDHDKEVVSKIMEAYDRAGDDMGLDGE